MSRSASLTFIIFYDCKNSPDTIVSRSVIEYAALCYYLVIIYDYITASWDCFFYEHSEFRSN